MNSKIPKHDGRKISHAKRRTTVTNSIPSMYMPFGVSGFTPEVGPTKYSLDFAMKGYDEDDNYVKKFYETMREFEEKIIDAKSKNKASTSSNAKYPKMNSKVCSFQTSRISGSQQKFRVRSI